MADDDVIEPLAGETVTANYGWTKPNPNGSDDIWGGQINADLDAIDAKVFELESGGGGGGGGGDYLPLEGGNLSGPVHINTATQPAMTIGWPQDTTLMQFGANTVTLNGNGGPAPATSNKTYLGVNQVGFGHKSWQGGNQPIYLSQSNQGEFYIQLGANPPVAFSDMKNGHPVRVSYDAGNAIVYGSDGAIFVPHGATAAEFASLTRKLNKALKRIEALEARRG